MATIPVVDFSALSLSIADEDKLSEVDVKTTADQMINAFTNIGFVYLSNTGFPRQLLEDVHSEGEQFFELPNTTKSRYAYAADNHGWTAMEQERLNPARPGDLKECFDVTLKAVYDDTRWPMAEIPNFKRVLMECFEACTKLTLRVLLAIAYGLDMKDVNYFARCHADITNPGGRPTSCMRMLKYPELPTLKDVKPNQVRLGEHTDYGSITLLFQGDIGGLQVKSPDGRWIDAVPMANTVLVNIADLLQRWTADRLISTPHRVMIPEEEWERMKVRRSLVFFAHPDADVAVTCVDGSDKYPPVNSVQYLDDRINSTYSYIQHTDDD